MSFESWSPDHLLDQIGNDLGLAFELLAVFLDETPEIVAGITDAVRRGDDPALAAAAHAFKGSAAAIGAFALAEAASRLEIAGREGRAAAMAGELGAFHDGVRRLEACLQSTLAGCAA